MEDTHLHWHCQQGEQLDKPIIVQSVDAIIPCIHPSIDHRPRWWQCVWVPFIHPAIQPSNPHNAQDDRTSQSVGEWVSQSRYVPFIRKGPKGACFKQNTESNNQPRWSRARAKHQQQPGPAPMLPPDSQGNWLFVVVWFNQPRQVR